MINYTIPGTGSSGHICGGILLSALLGPYAAFLSMISVLLIQCLFFADGGLMALGANIWNMAFYGCFVGYFLIYRPIMKGRVFSSLSERIRLILAVVLGSILTLQLGAFSVVIETTLSGITELPFGLFAGLMQPIHLAIGLVEGLITAAILLFVYETRKELIMDVGPSTTAKLSLKQILSVLVIITFVTGGLFSLYASAKPDGLEWALFGNKDEGYSENMALDEENYGISSSLADNAAKVQESMSFLPDYAFKDNDAALGTSVSGIVGSSIVALVAILFSLGFGFYKKKGAHKAA